MEFQERLSHPFAREGQFLLSTAFNTFAANTHVSTLTVGVDRNQQPTTINQQHTSNLVPVPVPVEPLDFPDWYRCWLKNSEMLLVLPISCR